MTVVTDQKERQSGGTGEVRVCSARLLPLDTRLLPVARHSHALFTQMSDLKSIVPGAPSAHLISEMRQRFDSLHTQLLQSHVTQVQEEKTKERMVAERDQALEQVVLLQSQVSDLQTQLQQLNASYKQDQEERLFRSKQQADLMEQKVSALTQDADSLRHELERLHMQRNSDARISLLVEQRDELVSSNKNLQSELQQVKDQVAGSKKLLNSAKLLIQKMSQSDAAERQQRQLLNNTIFDLKQEVAKLAIGGTAGSGLTDHFKQENERLQRLLRQKEKELDFNRYMNGMEKTGKEQTEQLMLRLQEVKRLLPSVVSPVCAPDPQVMHHV